MTQIRTTIINGRIEISAPPDLADGTEVLVTLLPTSKTQLSSAFEDSNWDDSPAGIQSWLDWYESLEPLELTSEELEQIESDRRSRKQWELSRFNEHADKLAKQWQ